jgi:hypothetical protein
VFGAKTRLPGAAPTYAASARRAWSSRPAKRRSSARNSTGLAFELALQALVLLEDRPRARTERAVVQVDDAGVEQELVAHA